MELVKSQFRACIAATKDLPSSPPFYGDLILTLAWRGAGRSTSAV
jgi:hypothetical protein